MQSFCGIRSSNTVPYTNTNRERMDHGIKKDRSLRIPVQHAKGATDKIREALHKVELSVSSYDTAWVAMVPSPSSLKLPCFPQCVDWILNNQYSNGSWGLPCSDPLLLKDSLSSTLACVLALRRWDVGEEHIRKGIRYIESNFSSTMDGKMLTPIGFDITFPNMVVQAKYMGLDLPMQKSDVDTICRLRDVELSRGSGGRSEGKKSYHAYAAEGLDKLHDWNEVMKFQKKNGSLFNSPSATAAAVIHTQDEKSLNYLSSLVDKFGNAVPTIYPLDIYTYLCIIDTLQGFGISEHFTSDIKSNLDKIYRCWEEEDEEIHSDFTTCAVAFRILRMNGYDVSSDALASFDEAHFNNSLQGYLGDTTAVLELYKASQVQTITNDQILQKVNSWSRRHLKEELSNGVLPNIISDEVNYVLKYPFYANLERLEHKRNIEHFNVEDFNLLKTSYRNCIVNKQDLLEVAMDDFNLCQSIYREELEGIESWVKANKLDQLEFSRQKQSYCYFSAAATLFSDKMSDARISWTKNSVLTTVVDDFFDIGSSREEQMNLITLVKKWDGNHENQFCSEQVRIVFSALHSTITEISTKAWKYQKRDVTNHIVEIWLTLMESMMEEAEWQRNNSVPTLDEYMRNAYVSFALGPIVLPALYFVGPELSEDIVRNPEYHKLFQLMSTCGRLLNDIQSAEREAKEGKLNSVTLLARHNSASTSIEQAKRDIQGIIDSNRAELLKLVLQSKGSLVPRPCKDLFWKMCRVVHVFYASTDGFSSPKEMVAAAYAVIHEPLNVNQLGKECSATSDEQ